MNKLSLGNFIASLSTIVLWLTSMIMCSAGVATRNRGLLVLGGLLILMVWAINFAGMIVGLITGLHDKKDWKAWVSLSLHAAQFGLTSFIFILGTISQHRHTNFIE